MHVVGGNEGGALVSTGSDRSRSRSRGGDKGERRKRRSDATHAAIGCVQLATDEGNTAVTAPLVHVTVGGLPVVAMLDTGAEVSLVASHVVVGLKDGPNLSRFQMATPVIVTGVGHEPVQLTHGVRLAVSMREASMRHQFFVAPAATRLPRGVDLLCGFDFMRRHAVSVSLPVRGEPSVVLQATGDHLPVLAKGAAVSDTPVVGAAMKGRLSARACDSDISGVGPSASERRRPAAGAGVGVDAGNVAGEQATRTGGMFSDCEEEDSGWDTPKKGVVLIGREARADTFDFGHVSKIQQRVETVDAQCRLGAADGWAYDEARRRVELAVGDGCWCTIWRWDKVTGHPSSDLRYRHRRRLWQK